LPLLRAWQRCRADLRLKGAAPAQQPKQAAAAAAATVFPRYSEPRHSKNPADSERRRSPQYQQMPNSTFCDSEQAGYGERAADPR
jgi:hypothetical protein